MDKYYKTYRICCEWDRSSLEPIKEDTYIQCARTDRYIELVMIC